MSERIDPTKFERRRLFSVADYAADVILADIAKSRPETTTSSRRSVWLQKLMLEQLIGFDPALPMVSLQLIRWDVRDNRANPGHDIRVKEESLEGFQPQVVGRGALIIATGLNRFVNVHAYGTSLSVGPDDHPGRVQEKFAMTAGRAE